MNVTSLQVKHLRKLIEGLPDNTRVTTCLDVASSACSIDDADGAIHSTLHGAVIVSLEGTPVSLSLINGVNTNDVRDGVVLPDVPQLHRVDIPTSGDISEEMALAIASVYSALSMEPILEP